ncbi:nucleotide sugar dehydrogenase [uncultured Desulfobulbus sp.]|uniref:nucleotide sugar dehydrogenase n=1 Tax=uncultured Desulfobulbus sp. TaxID=239745 RepID=UPI0029C74F7E|nr:nucleotide sugar dehydrogenase [uncultured Desulfobulbus sp.]
MKEKVAVVGLGYVGLPVALAFAAEFPGAIGFDINKSRVTALKQGIDKTGESSAEDLGRSTITFTSDINDLRDATFFVVAVPTPIDKANRPDLTPVRSASKTVGKVIKPGAVVVYESTVYPGVTEEICGPIIAEESGLKQGIDFKLGYSPERINPGDKEHTLTKIIKVVSGEDAETLDRVASAYGSIVDAGIHKAPSIKVAEAAKVIENTQRDLNIALMNELARIFDLMGICTNDVLKAAGTKWNFLKFTPGLVGGHCIGVDPYYLTTKAEELGYRPEVILAGRRINDSMGRYIAEKLVKLLIKADCCSVKKAKVGILGLTFKEDVPDLRNSRVPDIVNELKEYGISPEVHDPLVDHEEAFNEYGIRTVELDEIHDLDGLILAVPHKAYMKMDIKSIFDKLKPNGAFIDIKSAIDDSLIPDGFHVYKL